ncbi:hypothetical protein [Clostridium sp.]|uniref:hypothetical protein n=1 Tax=Clostridium sp. TaxID=1506 RepID=UPI00262F42B9|nr:hypothetical protein [Clostridium sp.]
MRIKEILNMNRRDFTAIYKCEFCGHEEKSYGYDDSNFHNNVIPNMKCKECGKVSGEVTSRATNPDYMQY